jgi:hypothetical protein
VDGRDGHRTLEALGLADAPRDHPLTCPGAWPTDSGLLDGDLLSPLDRLTFPDRTPVLAVGSNACPGQLRHRPRESRTSSPIPMVKARVTGIDVGVSGHVGRMGYVSASPVNAPGVTREFFLWLDDDRLAAVDATEPNFDRSACPPRKWRSPSRTAGGLRRRSFTSTAMECCTTATPLRAAIRDSTP